MLVFTLVRALGMTFIRRLVQLGCSQVTVQVTGRFQKQFCERIQIETSRIRFCNIVQVSRQTLLSKMLFGPASRNSGL